jgi:AraC-like DNA-binding protein
MWPNDTRGILRPAAAAAAFTLARYAPSPDLAPFVERYWIVRWSLSPGRSHLQDVLGQPSVDLVFEPGRAAVWGVVRGRLRRQFSGQGQALGVKFRPGGFYPFWRRPLSDLTDRTIPAAAAFRGRLDRLELRRAHAAATSADDAGALAATEAMLRPMLPARDRPSEIASGWVDLARCDRSLVRVRDLAADAGVSPRALERLFRRHIGVPPKWVLRRFRLTDAVDHADREGPIDWAALALRLGYADQSHLINEFRTYAGISPVAYRAGSPGMQCSRGRTSVGSVTTGSGT